MAEEPDQPHRDDGLDLARQTARATASSSPAARKRRAKRGTAPRDPTFSGAHPDDRDPQLIGDQVRRDVIEDAGHLKREWARTSQLSRGGIGQRHHPPGHAGLVLANRRVALELLERLL